MSYLRMHIRNQIRYQRLQNKTKTQINMDYYENSQKFSHVRSLKGQHLRKSFHVHQHPTNITQMSLDKFFMCLGLFLKQI
jgi:hypothetical protein